MKSVFILQQIKHLKDQIFQLESFIINLANENEIFIMSFNNLGYVLQNETKKKMTANILEIKKAEKRLQNLRLTIAKMENKS